MAITGLGGNPSFCNDLESSLEDPCKDFVFVYLINECKNAVADSTKTSFNRRNGCFRRSNIEV